MVWYQDLICSGFEEEVKNVKINGYRWRHQYIGGTSQVNDNDVHIV
jgi:hypothetical protein